MVIIELKHYFSGMVQFDPTLGVLKETVATIRKLKVGRG